MIKDAKDIIEMKENETFQREEDEVDEEMKAHMKRWR